MLVPGFRGLRKGLKEVKKVRDFKWGLWAAH